MAFAVPRNRDTYLKTERVWIDSRTSKQSPGQSDFNYRAILPKEMQNVVAISLASYQLPRDTVPSFYPDTTLVTGTNAFDFSLENTDIAATPQVFSATWPTKYYQYNFPVIPAHDYQEQVAKIMNDAINANATWKNKVRVESYPHPLENTILLVQAVGCALPAATTTTLRLLFASGVNAARACNAAMGFPKTDFTSNNTTFFLGTNTQALESPFPTALRPFAYVDVFVQEADQQPLGRIYVADTTYMDAKRSGLAQTRVDTRSPPRYLKSLTVRLRYPDNIDPGEYVSANTHSFGLDVTYLADEAEQTPGYTKQQTLAF